MEFFQPGNAAVPFLHRAAQRRNFLQRLVLFRNAHDKQVALVFQRFQRGRQFARMNARLHQAARLHAQRIRLPFQRGERVFLGCVKRFRLAGNLIH